MANQDFFLSPDDAQTLGDLKYMRKSVRVRHTFPKNLKNPQGFEIEKDISSIEDNSQTKVPKSGVESSISETTDSPRSFSSSKATSTSSNMDMFRNMARQLGRR